MPVSHRRTDGHIGTCWCTSSVHRNGKQRTTWTLRDWERKQEGRTRREGTTSISSLSTLLLPRGPSERGKTSGIQCGGRPAQAF